MTLCEKRKEAHKTTKAKKNNNLFDLYEKRHVKTHTQTDTNQMNLRLYETFTFACI